MLTLKGDGDSTVFAPSSEHPQSTMLMLKNTQCITVQDIKFTGSNIMAYALKILSSEGLSANHIVEGCKFLDLDYVGLYGAVGISHGASNIKILRNTFNKIGNKDVSVGAKAHMIYVAHDVSNIDIGDGTDINKNFFVDCGGKYNGWYLDFRDDISNVTIDNNEFTSTGDHEERCATVFINVVAMNDPEGETFPEYLSDTYTIKRNTFDFADVTCINNKRTVFGFHHAGKSPENMSYLMTGNEGAILESGLPITKKDLLEAECDINLDNVTLDSNIVTGAFPSCGHIGLKTTLT